MLVKDKAVTTTLTVNYSMLILKKFIQGWESHISNAAKEPQLSYGKCHAR
jgi:hypothetical protein